MEMWEEVRKGGGEIMKSECIEDGVKNVVNAEEMEEVYWRKNIPFLYRTLLLQNLTSPSICVEWISPPRLNGRRYNKAHSSMDYCVNKVLLGTTEEGGENLVFVCETRMPRHYRRIEPMSFETHSSFSSSEAGHSPMQLDIKAKLRHPGEPNQLRHMYQSPFILATQGLYGYIYIFDYAKHPSTPFGLAAQPQLILSHNISTIDSLQTNRYGIPENQIEQNHSQNTQNHTENTQNHTENPQNHTENTQNHTEDTQEHIKMEENTPQIPHQPQHTTNNKQPLPSEQHGNLLGHNNLQQGNNLRQENAEKKPGEICGEKKNPFNSILYNNILYEESRGKFQEGYGLCWNRFRRGLLLASNDSGLVSLFDINPHVFSRVMTSSFSPSSESRIGLIRPSFGGEQPKTIVKKREQIEQHSEKREEKSEKNVEKWEKIEEENEKIDEKSEKIYLKSGDILDKSEQIDHKTGNILERSEKIDQKPGNIMEKMLQNDYGKEGKPVLAPVAAIFTARFRSAVNDVQWHPMHHSVFGVADDRGYLTVWRIWGLEGSGNKRGSGNKSESGNKPGSGNKPESGNKPGSGNTSESGNKPGSENKSESGKNNDHLVEVIHSNPESKVSLELVCDLQGCKAPVRCLNFNEHNEFVVAVGCENGVIHVYDLRVKGGGPIFCANLHACSPVNQVAFSPLSPHILASCSDDAQVIIWNILGQNVPKNGQENNAQQKKAEENKDEPKIDQDSNKKHDNEEKTHENQIYENMENIEKKDDQRNHQDSIQNIALNTAVFIHKGHRSAVNGISWCLDLSQPFVLASVASDSTFHLFAPNDTTLVKALQV